MHTQPLPHEDWCRMHTQLYCIGGKKCQELGGGGALVGYIFLSDLPKSKNYSGDSICLHDFSGSERRALSLVGGICPWYPPASATDEYAAYTYMYMYVLESSSFVYYFSATLRQYRGDYCAVSQESNQHVCMLKLITLGTCMHVHHTCRFGRLYK